MRGVKSPSRRDVSVLIAEALPGAYDYAVPVDMTLKAGDIVRVPLGPRKVLGVVRGEGEGRVAAAKLRAVLARVDALSLPASLLKFIDWVADYTLSRPGAVLALAFKPAFVETQAKPVLVFRLSGILPDKLTPARRKVMDVASDMRLRTQKELAQAAAVGEAVVRGLITANVLKGQIMDAPSEKMPDGAVAGPALSITQRKTATLLREAVQARRFETFLLDGVPGAGKTEVYFEAVAQALLDGRQALVLMPEIALTVHFVERFAKRFGAAPIVWHSGMSVKSRREAWHAIAQGRAPLVVGARSALFLPFASLGTIVVDEEHDPAYKQEEGVIYNARDMAVVRGRIMRSCVILSSATPSLETYINAKAGRYRHLVLDERHGVAVMPQLESLDMRTGSSEAAPARGHFISPRLIAEIDENLKRGEQALIFLNRRGYAPLTLCRHCGHRFNCPNCSAWLVEHRARADLQCHHCGHHVPRPQQCPACGKEDTLTACGPGVERVAEEIAGLFPQARIAQMSSDTLPDAQSALRLYSEIAAGKIDLIIGTQLAAKGHHFPNLTLVGVVDADLGLTGGDLRASERSFQLLFQVAGRAGREGRKGRVLIQTYMPEHPVMSALVGGDRDSFLAAEEGERRASHFPPFGRLVGLILSSEKQAAAQTAAQKLARSAPQRPGVRVLGPAPAPLALLRGRHRLRLLVKARREVDIQAYMRQWLSASKLPSNVRLAIDVDPISFF